MARTDILRHLGDVGVCSHPSVYHFKCGLSKDDVKSLRRKMQELQFLPHIHEGVVARLECDLAISGTPLSGLQLLVQALSRVIGIEYRAVESYAFKYAEGHSVPWHQDSRRNLLTLLAYFGEFAGGEFVYQAESNSLVRVELAEGDFLVLINAVGGSHFGSAMHKVEPITGGVRYCVAVSGVS